MRERQKEFISGGIITSVIFILVSLSFLGGLFTGPEFFVEDRIISRVSVDPGIVVLSIDDESIEHLGQWPWPRAYFGKAFSLLNEYPPKSVGLDVMFSEKSRLGEGDDELLAMSLKEIDYPVIMPVEGINVSVENKKTRADSFREPLRKFLVSKNVHLGHVNLISDRDNVVRHYPISISSKDESFGAFSVEIAKSYGANISENESSNERIIFGHEIYKIPFYRFWEEPEIRKSLSGKMVLIGATAADLHDEKPTPISEGTETPGVEIQAHIANMVLRGISLKEASSFAHIIWFLLLSFIPFLFFIFTKSAYRALLGSLVFGVVASIVPIVLFEYDIVLNFIHTIFPWSFSAGSLFAYRYFETDKSRRELKKAFGKYVSPSVLDSIMANPDAVSLGGEEKMVTLLFSDIRGFTTLSEKLSPKDLVRVLNKYFNAMSEEILKNNGVLDKYIGDAIMAFWGAPLPDDLQAEHAFWASKGMISRLKELNKELFRDEGVEIDIGVGIYTGPAIVGNVGSETRFDYTAIGDTVNVASRLEGLNKDFKTHIIVGETTKELLLDSSELKYLAETKVKGRAEPLKIYTV